MSCVILPAAYPPLHQQWFNPAEAAIYLRLSDSELEKKCRLKTGPAFHNISARCIRYSRVDLDAWVNSHRNGGAE